MEKVNLIDSILLGIGGSIGGGIFILNGIVVNKVKNFSPLVWLFGGLICMTIAFSYIILSLEYKSDEGTLEYPKKLFDSELKKNIIDILIIFGYITLVAVYATSMSEYVSRYFSKEHLVKYIAIIIILICQIINYFPFNTYIKIADFTIFAKIIIFIGIIILGLLIPNKNDKNNKYINNNKKLKIINVLPNLIFLSFAIFHSYEGFELISNVSNKLDNPNKNLPLGFIISVISICFIYIGISYVTNKHIGNEMTENNKFSSIIDLIKKLGFVKNGPLIVIILCILSNFTAINSTIFSNKEIYDSYLDGRKERIFKILNKDFNIPFFSESRKYVIWLSSLLSCLLVFLPIFTINNLSSMIFLIIFLIISYLGLKLVLIKQKNNKEIFILGKKIPYFVAKSITSFGIISCLIGTIILLYESTLEIIKKK